MATNIQGFAVLTTALNAASSAASVPFGFTAHRIEITNLSSTPLWFKLGTTGVASSADFCVTSCVPANVVTVDLGFGYGADMATFFATSTAVGQFVVNAFK